MVDFKLDMINLYASTGLKGNDVVFLFTDQQIVDERMLVYLNDLLSSGYIPELYNGTTRTTSSTRSARGEAGGLMDSRDNCWEYFIEKVR